NTALLLSEYLVTFPDEVEFFWSKKWTGATALFFMNRYVSLLYPIFNSRSMEVLT
ncbi:hypothetical protein C8Q76DRAFT_567637, partial [Earliella scabrosa]